MFKINTVKTAMLLIVLNHCDYGSINDILLVQVHYFPSGSLFEYIFIASKKSVASVVTNEQL